LIQTKTESINGRVWSVTQWSGTKNFDVLFNLATVVGPTLAHGVVPGQALLSANVNLGGAVDALVKSLGTSQQAQGLLMKLLSNVRIDDKPVDNVSAFDALFSGPAFFDIVPGLKFVVEVNFGDFFAMVAGIMSLSGVLSGSQQEEEISPAA
jgi:hypothetical protein